MSTTSRAVLAAALIALAGACKKEKSAPAPDDDPDTFAIRDVRVFDGERFVESTDVVVRDGRIESVGRPVPEGIRVIDGRGSTLLPGLMDAHAHPRDAGMLEQSLSLGVTTLIGMSAPPEPAAESRRREAEGGAPGWSSLRAAGWALTAPGGLGTDIEGAEVLGEGEDPAAFIEARITAGADHIEILFDDGRAWGAEAPRIDEAQLRAAIAAAHAGDRVVVVDTASHAETATAVAAGADGLAHLYVEGPNAELAAAIARSKTFVVATLPVLFSICDGSRGRALADDPHIAPFIAPESSARLRLSYHLLSPGVQCAELLAATRELHEAGVDLLVGSDSPQPGTAHGASVHDGLELLVRAGLSPAEALKAATSTPARRFKLEDRGRIARGQRADLVLVGGDPRDGIRATRAIRSVWKAGREVDRRARVAAIAKLPRHQRPKLEPGSIGTFDDQSTPGWVSQSDRIDGGGSTVEVSVVEEGARGTAIGLIATGALAGEAGWAGVLRFVHDTPPSAADLGAVTALAFFARGDGGTYEVVLHSEGDEPLVLGTFDASDDWSQTELSLEAVALDRRRRAVALGFRARGEARAFRFELDEVELR